MITFEELDSSSAIIHDTYIENIEIINSNTMEPKYTGAIPKNPPQNALINHKVEYLPKNFQSVVDKINQGLRVVVLLRGLPGSGKSFLSYQIIEQTVKTVPGDHIVSADKFFINNRGQYKFEPSKISDAHSFAQKQFVRSASSGLSPLIVDNTNLETWEMFYYLQVASQYGYHVEIMEPDTPWKNSSALLAKKNQHSVPKDKIDKMKIKYETGTVETLMRALNLQVVLEPKLRNIPPLPIVEKVPEVFKDPPFPAIKTPSSFQWSSPSDVCDTTDSPLPQSSSSSSQQEIFDIGTQLAQIFDQKWEEIETVKKPPETEIKETTVDALPQRKPRKNKTSPQPKLTAHCKDCPNENQIFAIIRNLYPDCNDSYLWDFFVRCNGDADWCVNLLCDENLTGQMDPGCDLTCSCFGGDVTKVVVEKIKKETPQPQSQAVKSKKAKTEAAKQLNVDEWLETKEAIERSITIGQEHFPEHVNIVKNWKNGQKQQQMTEAERPETPKVSVPSDVEEDLQELPIAKDLILELDEEYGGGLLKSLMEDENFTKFPPKIFIRKSTAYKLYIEIMEAYYAQEEESKLNMVKSDEEYAKLLNQKEQMPRLTQKSSAPVQPSVWTDEGETSDDMALRMSKEKLVQLFPQLNKDDLMAIFEATGYNFEDTLATVQDSLFCTPEQRKQIAVSRKIVFNSPWRKGEVKKVEVTKKTEENGKYTVEHLKTVEDLRQEIFDHQEEQKACRRKAQEAIQKKQYEYATFLSNIASFHKQMEAEATHEVANLMAGIHEKTQGSSTTLDLHYLNLIEAACLLETFLDRHIERVRNIRKPFQELFIITGRGAHSANGVANIKIRTKSRLQERSLSCIDNSNPGVLKVRVYPQSPLSNEIYS